MDTYTCGSKADLCSHFEAENNFTTIYYFTFSCGKTRYVTSIFCFVVLQVLCAHVNKVKTTLQNHISHVHISTYSHTLHNKTLLV